MKDVLHATAWMLVCVLLYLMYGCTLIYVDGSEDTEIGVLTDNDTTKPSRLLTQGLN